MKEKPVRSGTLFEKALITRVVLHGLFITAVTILAYQIGLKTDSHIVRTDNGFYCT
ncbi:MAG: hypothetical protein HFJ50_06210 [Clostridia bacterium]|nr:hypothetical protein [Clostridia bacterium]